MSVVVLLLVRSCTLVSFHVSGIPRHILAIFQFSLVQYGAALCFSFGSPGLSSSSLCTCRRHLVPHVCLLLQWSLFLTCINYMHIMETLCCWQLDLVHWYPGLYLAQGQGGSCSPRELDVLAFTLLSCDLQLACSDSVVLLTSGIMTASAS